MFNPVRLPYISAPLGMSYVLPEHIDRVQAAMSDRALNIVSHYPLSFLWSDRSVASGFSRADFMLSGHSHPRRAQLRHSEKSLQVVNPATDYGEYVGVMTVEPGGFVYHDFVPSQRFAMFVTFLVPLEQ
jgi:hypothetical protein